MRMDIGRPDAPVGWFGCRAHLPIRDEGVPLYPQPIHGSAVSSSGIQRRPNVGGQVSHGEWLLNEMDPRVQYAVVGNDIGRIARHE